MKKLLLALLLTSLFLTVSVNALAQTTEKDDSLSAVPTVAKASDYQLPYPGMLPDHPLYKLKVLRDKIILFLIRDPIKKAERHLQMADKELFMALKLAEKGKIPLAQHTAFKAENHITLLVAEVQRAAYSGRGLNKELVQKAHRAALKHQELLDGMINRAGKEQEKPFQIIKEFSHRNDHELFRLEKEIETKNNRFNTPTEEFH